jgi:anti-sigma-K factor RskA
MRDEAADFTDPDLACTALLYASGELEEAQAAEFERRLAEDQAAREALCQAVQLNLTLAGQSAAPDPAYRARVRQRLQQRRRHMRKLAGSPAFFGQPAMWAALGAAIAVVLMLVLHHFASFPTPNPPATQPGQTPPLADRQELEQKRKQVSTQADQLVQQLASPATEEERKAREGKLRDLAREMVDLDIQLLHVKARDLEKELGSVKDEEARAVAERDKMAQKRFEELLDQAKKGKTRS